MSIPSEYNMWPDAPVHHLALVLQCHLIEGCNQACPILGPCRWGHLKRCKGRVGLRCFAEHTRGALGSLTHLARGVLWSPREAGPWSKGPKLIGLGGKAGLLGVRVRPACSMATLSLTLHATASTVTRVAPPPREPEPPLMFDEPPG